MDEIIPGLYQTSSLEFQDGNHLDAVVVLNQRTPPQRHGRLLIHWPIDDGPMPAANKARAVARWIAEMVDEGMQVAVQCAAGINRSGLISARALIALDYQPEEAIELVRQARPGALNNPSFVNWLLQERPS